MATLHRIPRREPKILCNRCGAIEIGPKQITGGFLVYCGWDYTSKSWFIENRRCHCAIGATKYGNLPLYDDGRWAHEADDDELCTLREIEVKSARSRFDVWEGGKKFVKGRCMEGYEPVRDPRGEDWFRGPPEPAWQNPSWKGDADG